MKKARLKINYQEGNLKYLKNEIISNFYNEGYAKKVGDIIVLDVDFVKSNPDIFEVFEEKSAEELAKELEFKIGDKIWFQKEVMEKGKYAGIIDSFCIINGDLNIRLKGWNGTGNGEIFSKLIQPICRITNKVAIHCSSEEDFEFICKVTGNPLDSWGYENKTCLVVNYSNENGLYSDINWFKQENWLILTVNEYCKSQGIEYPNNLQPKKVVEVEIPEGYKLEGIDTNELKNHSLATKGTMLYWKKIEPIKSCKTCLFELHKDKQCDNCHSKEDNSCTKWQSKQDLSNTKIYIGDNPKLSKLVQKKAFELGYKWCTGDSDIVNVNGWIYIHTALSWQENDLIKYNCTEITPQDLGIKEEDYKVILTTENGVKLYIGDHVWSVSKNNYYLHNGYIGNNFVQHSDILDFSTKQAAEKYIFDKKLEELKQQYNQ